MESKRSISVKRREKDRKRNVKVHLGNWPFVINENDNDETMGDDDNNDDYSNIIPHYIRSRKHDARGTVFFSHRFQSRSTVSNFAHDFTPFILPQTNQIYFCSHELIPISNLSV